MRQDLDKLVTELTRKYSNKKEPIKKREIFDYMRKRNYNVEKINEVIYKLYINSFWEIHKTKQKLKEEKISRNAVQIRLNEWLTREYYRPPMTDGGPGYYETQKHFNEVINSDNHHLVN
tara:strand:- start:377 stop:733 length:357 start_codon:yes stop_codon:yes gene_type:complete